MIKVTNWMWVFDDIIATCQQTGEGVAVDFGELGKVHGGKPQDNPMALFEMITELNQDMTAIEQIVREFEKELYGACFI